MAILTVNDWIQFRAGTSVQATLAMAGPIFTLHHLQQTFQPWNCCCPRLGTASYRVPSLVWIGTSESHLWVESSNNMWHNWTKMAASSKSRAEVEGENQGPSKPTIVFHVSQKKVWREEARVLVFPILLVQEMAMDPLWSSQWQGFLFWCAYRPQSWVISRCVQARARMHL